MKVSLSGRALFGILFIVAALVGTPIAVYQLQQQQEIRQRADTTLAWATNQAAATECPAYGGNVVINVSFKNTEPNQSKYSMNVVARDRQTGKVVNLGSIRGGQTKTAVIQTDRASLNAGAVDFGLTWTDGHAGIDVRAASYKAISNCNPAPTEPPYSTPYPTVTEPYTTPYITPSVSPTICPTLGPVKNVKIDCPNCPKY